MDRILDILQALGIPFAYDHFAEGESPEPPFICTCSRPAILLPPLGRFISKRRKSTSSSTQIPRMWCLRQVSKLCLMSTAFFMTKARSG